MCDYTSIPTCVFVACPKLRTAMALPVNRETGMLLAPEICDCKVHQNHIIHSHAEAPLRPLALVLPSIQNAHYDKFVTRNRTFTCHKIYGLRTFIPLFLVSAHNRHSLNKHIKTYFNNDLDFCWCSIKRVKCRLWWTIMDGNVTIQLQVYTRMTSLFIQNGHEWQSYRRCPIMRAVTRV